MSDDLLPYYNRELEYLRRAGNHFSRMNPRIAGRLRLGAELSEDPHVARMIESFAYLNARTRHKLEDDFPEITEALLGVLYPHYLTPIPSAAIVELTLDRGQAELYGGYQVDRGTFVETETIEGEPCRFRSCYPVTLYPLGVENASLGAKPFPAPETPFSGDVKSILRIDLNGFSDRTECSKLELDFLRFYLHGQAQTAYGVYELLLNNLLGVAVASAATDGEPQILDSKSVQPVGFESDEGLLQFPSRSFLGYRLLTELFAFPQKFLFFDVALPRGVLDRIGSHLELYFYLNRQVDELERFVDGGSFRLGCCPVMNLFEMRAEPIHFDHTATETRVVPDARRPLAYEIYSVDRVQGTSADDTEVDYQPFYSTRHASNSTRHGTGGDGQRAYWHATRRAATTLSDKADRGTEMYLSLVDLDFNERELADTTIDVETTCLNRDLPYQLPFGGGEPRLQMAGGAPLGKIECLTRPTPTLRPALGRGTTWRLISHLCLNHTSLIDDEEGASALREILTLYDFTGSEVTRDMIDGLVSVSSRRVVGRVGGSVSGGMCRGLEVTLDLDESKYVGTGVFLFASVLARFLGLYSSINSFTKVVATTNRREGVLHRWPPRAGEKVLL